jgi:tyrosine-protein phosphatase SIW14
LIRPRRVFTCAYAIVLLLGASALTSAATPATIGIDNFGRINDAYYRGAQPQGRDYEDLAALGVKTIVDLTATDEASADEPALVAKAGMKLVRIPLTTHDEPGSDAVTRFLAVVNDPANQPVYVHCQGGRHRTGALTAVYRMTHDGWSAARAFAEMQQYKFGPAFLHSALKNFVYGYPTAAQVAGAAAATATAAKTGSEQ